MKLLVAFKEPQQVRLCGIYRLDIFLISITGSGPRGSRGRFRGKSVCEEFGNKFIFVDQACMVFTRLMTELAQLRLQTLRRYLRQISPLGSSSITAEIRASYKASHYLANYVQLGIPFGKKEFPRNPSLRRITGIFVTKKGIPSGTSQIGPTLSHPLLVGPVID